MGTEAKAEMAVASADSAPVAWRATSTTKVEAEAATPVATESANSGAAAVWRRLAAAAAGAESGCTAACTGCERRLFTCRCVGVRRRRVLVHRDEHWLVREMSRDSPRLGEIRCVAGAGDAPRSAELSCERWRVRAKLPPPPPTAHRAECVSPPECALSGRCAR